MRNDLKTPGGSATRYVFGCVLAFTQKNRVSRKFQPRPVLKRSHAWPLRGETRFISMTKPLSGDESGCQRSQSVSTAASSSGKASARARRFMRRVRAGKQAARRLRR